MNAGFMDIKAQSESSFITVRWKYYLMILWHLGV